jgi:hypothetical protein
MIFISWAPDSEQFIGWIENRLQLGKVGSPLQPLSDHSNWAEWLDSSHFLYLYSYWQGHSTLDEYRLGFLDEPSITLFGPLEEIKMPDFAW